MTINDLAPIGYVLRPHGIRGELVFVPGTDDLSLVQGTVYLRPKNGGQVRAYTITGYRAHHGSLLLSFEGLADRTAAEGLKSHTVLVERSRLPKPADDEVFLADLPGLPVEVQADDGTWQVLGHITAVDTPTGQMLWTIRTAEGRDVMFPAVDEFIVSLDPAKGLVRIAPPPGLLELYL